MQSSGAEYISHGPNWVAFVATAGVILLLLAAVLRSLKGGRVFTWMNVLVVVVFVAALGAKLSARSQAERQHHAPVPSQIVEFPALGGPISEIRVSAHPRGQATALTTKSFPLSGVVLLLIAIGIFMLVRHTRHGASGAIPAWAAVVFSMLLVMFGLRWVRTAHEPIPPQMVYSQPATVLPMQVHQRGIAPQAHAEEPIDELWERLNKPRIQLTAEAPDQPVSISAATDEIPAQVLAEAEDGHIDAAATESNASDDDDTGSEGENAADESHGDERTANEHVAEENTSEESSHDESAPIAPVAEIARAAATVGAIVAGPAPTLDRDPAPPKPDWVRNPPKLITGSVRRYVVQAGPYATLNECYDKLRMEMRLIVQQRIADLARATTGNAHVYVPDLESMHISDDDIVRELMTDEFTETGLASFGETKTAWGLLEFNDAQDQRLLDGWKKDARREGIRATTALSAVVLAVLGGVFALLKIDTWTRGYYTKRLFLGVPAAIIGLVFVLSFFAP